MALEQALEEHLCQENKQSANLGKNNVSDSSIRVHLMNDGLRSKFFQVAFMASMATHFSNQNSGIIFSSVETNVGNFFDVMTGRFGAPVNGEYLSNKIMQFSDLWRKVWSITVRKWYRVSTRSDSLCKMITTCFQEIETE